MHSLRVKVMINTRVRVRVMIKIRFSTRVKVMFRVMVKHRLWLRTRFMFIVMVRKIESSTSLTLCNSTGAENHHVSALCQSEIALSIGQQSDTLI